jgi:hypothetical protein
MSHTVKFTILALDVHNVRACPTDVLEMVIWEDCRGVKLLLLHVQKIVLDANAVKVLVQQIS